MMLEKAKKKNENNNIDSLQIKEKPINEALS